MLAPIGAPALKDANAVDLACEGAKEEPKIPKAAGYLFDRRVRKES